MVCGCVFVCVWVDVDGGGEAIVNTISCYHDNRLFNLGLKTMFLLDFWSFQTNFHLWGVFMLESRIVT